MTRVPRGQAFYPTDVTPAEATAGFKLADIPYPGHRYYGDPATIRAVIYPCGPSHRVAKMSVLGKLVYQLQVFGRYAALPQDTKPEWLPVEDLRETDPNTVAEAIARHIRESSRVQRVIAHTTPADADGA